jgi:hypothetical protein
MADDSERWQRVQKRSLVREPFHSKASPVALHMDPQRRRNLDKEQAARDRMIFRWVMFVLSIAGLLALMMFVLMRLS